MTFDAVGPTALRSLDTGSGIENWSIESEDFSEFGYLAATTGRVYVSELTALGWQLTALDAASGERLWTRGNVQPFAVPAVGGGRIVVACDAGICAYDRSGVLRWSFNGQGEVSIVGRTVYMGCPPTHFCAVDLRTGSPQTSLQVFDVVTSVTVAGELAYLLREGSGRVYRVIDIASGEVFDGFGPPGTIAPVVANGRAYFAEANRLYIYTFGS